MKSSNANIHMEILSRYRMVKSRSLSQMNIQAYPGGDGNNEQRETESLKTSLFSSPPG